VKEWWAPADMLIVRYNDQSFNFGPNAPTATAGLGYPDFWLQMAGYNARSYYPGWMQPAKDVPSLMPAEEHTLAKRARELSSMCDAVGKPAGGCKDPDVWILGSTPVLVNLGSAVPAPPQWDFSSCALFVVVGLTCGAMGGAIGFRFGASKSQRSSSEHAGYLRIDA